MIYAAAPLLGFWLFVGWRVRVERGRVLSPMRGYMLAMNRLARVVGAAFVPVVAATTRRMVAFAEAFEASIAEAEAALHRTLELSEGYTVAYDARDLLHPDTTTTGDQ